MKEQQILKLHGDYLSENGDGEVERVCWGSKGESFCDAHGKPCSAESVNGDFCQSGENGGYLLKVTPHVLRTSTVTYLKQQGFQDSDIMKVPGHASSSMVCAYDKTSQ